MKKIVSTGVITLLCVVLCAQSRSDSTEYLISSKRLNLRLRMQTSIGYEATFINQSPVSSIGLELGLLYARTYYLGLYGYSGFLNNGYQDVTSFDSIAVVNDGGMRLGYNIKPHKAVHVNTSVKIGLLGINVINTQGISTFPSTLSITPSVEVELNLTRWLKLGLSAGWRWANKSTDFFKENKVNSLAYGFVFRVGRFAR